MLRFIIHFGDGVYLRDIDKGYKLITTQDIQNSAIMVENGGQLDNRLRELVINVVEKHSGWWEKVYIHITPIQNGSDEHN